MPTHKGHKGGMKPKDMPMKGGHMMPVMDKGMPMKGMDKPKGKGGKKK